MSQNTLTEMQLDQLAKNVCWFVLYLLSFACISFQQRSLKKYKLEKIFVEIYRLINYPEVNYPEQTRLKH